MSTEWYLMGNPQIYNGGYEGDEWNNYASDGFSELLDTSMLCDTVDLVTSDFSKTTTVKAVVQSVTENSVLKAEERQLLVPIGTLTGSDVYSYVCFDDVVYIIESEPTNNKFYEKVLLKVCNNKLRWQDAETKKILEYWFYSEDTTRYSPGVFKGNIIVKYDKQYSLQLPQDENTKKLHDGMRFMLEKSNDMPLVFQLTKYDGVTGNYKTTKILKVTLTQTVYNEETDNPDLMIADYYERQAESESTEYHCRIDFESDVISACSFGEFKAVITDENGTPVDETVTWSLESEEFDVSKLQMVQKSDNVVKIITGNDVSIIDKTFDLLASVNGSVLASITITIVPLW